jgi:glycosyltransferase involved in cell wall biosynthesis
MRVLHLLKTARGAAWALRQVAELRRAGVDIVVALPPATPGLAPQYAEVGATVVPVDLDFTTRHPWRLANALRRCRCLASRVRPDVIHSHFVSTTLVARIALGRQHPTPRLFQVPGPLHLEHAPYRMLDLATAGPCDAWIASCRWTREEYLRRGVPSERVFLSYYGADLAGMRSGTRGAFRHALGLDPHTPLVGLVAYLYPPKWFLGQRRGIKGHEDFIDAFAEVVRVRPEVRAVVVGGAWANATSYEEKLRAYARRRCGTAIFFTGTRGDVPNVYADLDVAVHPSLSENCGGAVESLAAACPTIATAVGGLPDVVRAGRTGWLVPPHAPQRLAAAILEALANPTLARARAHAGRALVNRLFDSAQTGRNIVAVYEHVLRDRRAVGAAPVEAPAHPRVVA